MHSEQFMYLFVLYVPVNQFLEYKHQRIKPVISWEQFIHGEDLIVPLAIFVTSKLDSNNSLPYDITNTQVARLQCLQNIAARIITYTKRTITYILRTYHISPVLAREPITYLLCLQIYTGYQLNKDSYTVSLFAK